MRVNKVYTLRNGKIKAGAMLTLMHTVWVQGRAPQNSRPHFPCMCVRVCVRMSKCQHNTEVLHSLSLRQGPGFPHDVILHAIQRLYWCDPKQTLSLIKQNKWPHFRHKGYEMSSTHTHTLHRDQKFVQPSMFRGSLPQSHAKGNTGISWTPLWIG